MYGRPSSDTYEDVAALISDLKDRYSDLNIASTIISKIETLV